MLDPQQSSRTPTGSVLHVSDWDLTKRSGSGCFRPTHELLHRELGARWTTSTLELEPRQGFGSGFWMPSRPWGPTKARGNRMFRGNKMLRGSLWDLTKGFLLGARKRCIFSAVGLRWGPIMWFRRVSEARRRALYVGPWSSFNELLLSARASVKAWRRRMCCISMLQPPRGCYHVLETRIYVYVSI